MFPENNSSLQYASTQHVYNNILPKGTLVSGKDTLHIRVSRTARIRKTSCNDIVLSSNRPRQVATSLGHVRRRSAISFVNATVVTCIRWQPKWLFNDHNVESRSHPSLLGSVPWFSTFGTRSWANQPVKPWNNEGKWLDFNGCNLSALERVVSHTSWEWTPCIECRARQGPCGTLDGGGSGEAAASSSGVTGLEGTPLKGRRYRFDLAYLQSIASAISSGCRSLNATAFTQKVTWIPTASI